MANIVLKNINKVYINDVIAVDDFNLEIIDKEFIILVGPSGCGKSTILRMIAGLEDITAGELYIGERLMNDLEPKDRDIAMVFQNYALYPHMTVYKNMAFSLKLRKMKKEEIDRRVQEAALILSIEHLLNRKPKTLSGGQCQRVALGRAMVRNPSVFLLDEPLSNLDAKLRTDMRVELLKLHRRIQTTFVYVTHDQIEAMTMGDRIVVMNNGVIQQVDTPKNVYNSPSNIFVAGFIGNPQMNFLDVILNKDDRGYYLKIHESCLYIPVEKTSELLKQFIGLTVKLGIRPENIYDDAASISANIDSTINAIVDSSEMVGSDIYLHLDYVGYPITARVAPTTSSKVGSNVKVAIDMNKIHLFDIVSGETINGEK